LSGVCPTSTPILTLKRGEDKRTKLINRYLSEGNDRKIRENESSAEEIKSQISSANDARATVEAQIAIIQDELGRSESYRSNINFNILDRGEIKQIKELQDKIAEIDLDSMAKARKEFNIKYKDKMEEEKAVADEVSLSLGERSESGRLVKSVMEGG
jgi:DNA repair protein RAD50